MAAPRLRAAKFDERMTLVEHLDELRNRIIVSAAVLVVACGLCFWQSDLLLDIANNAAARRPGADHVRRRPSPS